jgi:hypothetical protein
MVSLSDIYSNSPERLMSLKAHIDNKILNLKFEQISNQPKEEIISFMNANLVPIVLFLYAVDNSAYHLARVGYDQNEMYAKALGVDSQEWDLSPYIAEKDLPFFYYILEYTDTYNSLDLCFSIEFNGKLDVFNLICEEIEYGDEYSYSMDHMITTNKEHVKFFYNFFMKHLKENYDDVYKRSMNPSFTDFLSNSPFNTYIIDNHDDLKYRFYDLTESERVRLYDIFENEYCQNILEYEERYIIELLDTRFKNIIKKQ